MNITDLKLYLQNFLEEETRQFYENLNQSKEVKHKFSASKKEHRRIQVFHTKFHLAGNKIGK